MMARGYYDSAMLRDMGVDPDDYDMPEVEPPTEAEIAEKNATPEEIAAWEAKQRALDEAEWAELMEEGKAMCADDIAFDIAAPENADVVSSAECPKCGNDDLVIGHSRDGDRYGTTRITGYLCERCNHAFEAWDK